MKSIVVCLPLFVITSPAGDDLAAPDEARAIAEQMWAMFDKINDVQLRFRSEMRPVGGNASEAGRRWDKGFYAYKRGGYELLRYEETEAKQTPIAWSYVLTPETLQGWREDPQTGSRTGAVRQPTILNFRVQWAPGHYLPIGLIQDKVRQYLMTGDYVVRLPEGKAGDPQLIAPVAKPPVPPGVDASRITQMNHVITLSRAHGMVPIKIVMYRDKVKQIETTLELAETSHGSGIWLAEHGVCRQLTGGGGVFVKGVESEYWLEPGSLKVNAGLADTFFDPEFPAGTRVWDDVTKSQFVEGEKTGGRESDLAGLASRAEQMVPVQQPPAGPVAADGWSWTGSLAAALLLAALTAVFWTVGRKTLRFRTVADSTASSHHLLKVETQPRAAATGKPRMT